MLVLPKSLGISDPGCEVLHLHPFGRNDPSVSNALEAGMKSRAVRHPVNFQLRGNGVL
jgi:hypothetical protein